MSLKIETLELDQLTSDPTSPIDGQLWYNDTTKQLVVRQNSTSTNVVGLSRSANDFSTFTEKSSPVSADLILIEDSAATGAKKKVQIGNLPGGTGGDAWKPQIDIGGLLVLVDQGSKVISNDFPALELHQGKTRFGIWSGVWQKTPTSDISMKVKFSLSESGTGSYVRVALKVKAVGAGEDTGKAFDSSQFVAVSISPTNIGPEYEGTITFSSSIFAAHDTISLHIGRDGNNEMGGGSNDDYNKPIDIIAVEVL